MKNLFKNDAFCLILALLLLVGVAGFAGYAVATSKALVHQLTSLPR